MFRSAPRRLAAPLLAFSATLASCRYVDQRLTDLGDCFVYRWHQDALGVGVDAKLGPLALALGGWYAEWGSGKDTWWQTPGNTMTNHGTGVPFTTAGPILYGQSLARVLATSSSGNHPAEPQAFDDVTSWVLLTDTFDLDDESPYRLSTTQRIVDLFGVEVGAAPLFWHGHVGFNAAEFADFLLGFVGLDLLGDDGVRRPPTRPVRREPAR